MRGAEARTAGVQVTEQRRYRKQPWLVVLAACGLLAGLARLTSAPPVLRSMSFHDDFTLGRLDPWLFPYPEDWEVLSEGPGHYLHMKRSRAPGVPRRPLQFARLKGLNMASFELSLRVRREGRSMIVVFNYVDTMHFYYTHLSQDRGSDQPVHNGIFIVNGGPRERLAGLEAPPALPDPDWHQVRIRRDASTGSIKVFVDAQNQPLFAVNDTTFGCGEIGLGSFDETGDFADVRLEAQDVDCNPGGKAVVRPARAE